VAVYYLLLQIDIYLRDKRADTDAVWLLHNGRLVNFDHATLPLLQDGAFVIIDASAQPKKRHNDSTEKPKRRYKKIST